MLLAELIDKKCCADDNLQHLLHVFEGYRDKLLGNDECEYSPDSARAISWTTGKLIAEQDFSNKKETNEKTYIVRHS